MISSSAQPVTMLLAASRGDDTARGGDGNDSVFGGAGEDDLFGDAGNDLVSGGADDDVVDGGAGDDRVRGDAGDDILEGGVGNDAVLGGAGDDIVNGSNGTAMGSGEVDILTGNAGADRFILGAAGGIANLYYSDGIAGDPVLGDYAVITDFTIGEDIVQLTNLGINGYSLQNSSGSAELRVTGSNELIARFSGLGNDTNFALNDTTQFNFV